MHFSQVIYRSAPVWAWLLLACVGCGQDPNAGRASVVIDVDDSNFSELVLESELPVLVDYYATWCGPCHALAPTIDQVAWKHEGTAVVARVDVDIARQAAVNAQANSIPLLVVYKDGKEVGRLVGVVSMGEIETLLASASSS